MTAQAQSQATSTESPQNSVLAEVRNHIGHLTLNRPAGLNAITLDMVRSLSTHLRAWADDAQVHAVVLRGAGEKAFCAGAISARCTTASRAATRCMKTSSLKSTPSTWPFITTASRSSR